MLPVESGTPQSRQVAELVIAISCLTKAI